MRSSVPITILTQPPLSLKQQALSLKLRMEHFVRCTKRAVCGQSLPPSPFARGTMGGPAAVRNSLLRGLDQSGISYRYNPPEFSTTSTVGVLSGIDALRWAIQAKQDGCIRRLIAGPNLVVSALDENGILLDPSIDCVITPCPWVRQMYLEKAPVLAGKLVEWPAGVDEHHWKPSQQPDTRQYDFLVYAKFQEPENAPLLERITQTLKQRKLSFHLLRYGSYTPADYLTFLQNSRALVFLSESESQGIAQFEAWACDVPVLAWDRGLWRSGTESSPASSCPFLTNENGLRFKGENDWDAVLESFLLRRSEFHPRDFITRHYTLELSARDYVKICTGGENM